MYLLIANYMERINIFKSLAVCISLRLRKATIEILFPCFKVSSVFIPWEASKQRALEIGISETHMLRQGEE